MGGISFDWLAVWVLSQTGTVANWRYVTFVRGLGEVAAPGEGSAGRAPTLHRVPWHLPYN